MPRLTRTLPTLLAWLAAAPLAALTFGETVVHRGVCDASAAVPVGAGHFVVANDEDDRLRVYVAAVSGDPLPVVVPTARAMRERLGLTTDREMDIEAAARLGDRTFWITSHGRNNDGKWRPNRYRLFATTGPPEDLGGPLELVGVGRDLRESLAEHSPEVLGAAIGPEGEKVSSLAAKDAGLNIEGLAPAPDNRSLWIAFRNPRPKRPVGSETPPASREMALLLPLLNPGEVTRDPNAEPRFGELLEFDLDGLGFRAIDHSAAHGAYFLIAGPHDSPESDRDRARRPSRLYWWSGRPGEAPGRLGDVPSLNPEAIVTYGAGADHLDLLSDDGSMPVWVPSAADCADPDDFEALAVGPGGRCECKDLVDPNRKSFKSVRVYLD